MQIYGKIKVHIFSNTLEETKLDRIAQKSKYHTMLKSNPAAASMFPCKFSSTVHYGKTMASLDVT